MREYFLARARTLTQPEGNELSGAAFAGARKMVENVLYIMLDGKLLGQWNNYHKHQNTNRATTQRFNEFFEWSAVHECGRTFGPPLNSQLVACIESALIVIKKNCFSWLMGNFYNICKLCFRNILLCGGLSLFMFNCHLSLHEMQVRVPLATNQLVPCSFAPLFLDCLRIGHYMWYKFAHSETLSSYSQSHIVVRFFSFFSYLHILCREFIQFLFAPKGRLNSVDMKMSLVYLDEDCCNEIQCLCKLSRIAFHDLSLCDSAL